ncbi:MAG: hypothetical protein ACRETW_14455 [Stenotrophobium sp.]
MKKLLFLMIAASVTWQAQAQQSAVANAAQAGVGDVPQMDCKQPSPPPQIEPSQLQIDGFNKNLVLYKKCIEDYVGDRQKVIKQLNDQVIKNTDAANAAVKQFNDFNKSMGERNGHVDN